MTTAPAPRAGCPVQLTTFIGREREIAAVNDLLQSTRLVTLTGVGGAGKTRLAAEVPARVTPRFEASPCVDLASLPDPALVAALLAARRYHRRGGPELRSRQAVSRARPRGASCFLTRRRERPRGRADLPAARRHSVGDRAGGGASGRARAPANRGPARRLLQAAHLLRPIDRAAA